MQGRDQLGGMALDLWRDAPAIGLDKVHGEEVGLSQMHGGTGNSECRASSPSM